MADVVGWFLVAGRLGSFLAAGGALGLLFSLFALVAVARGSRWGTRLGVASAALGVACALGGGAGVLHGRVSTDASVSGERPVERQRQRRDGYLAAQAPARAGLLAAALPLLLGMAAVFASRRRRAPATDLAAEEETIFAPRDSLLLPAGVTALGVLSAGFAVAALLEPVPGRNLRADETARHLADHLEDIRRSSDAEVLLRACAGLEQEMRTRRETLDRALLPALPAAARRCVEQGIQQAALRRSLGAARSDLETLGASPLVERDAELQRLLASALEQVKQIAAAAAEAASAPRRPARIQVGAVTVAGRLSRQVVERIVRRDFERLRECYARGLAADQELAGRIAVRFTVAPSGAVSTVENTDPDPIAPGVVACAMRIFSAMEFPAPAGGSENVTFTLLLSPPDADEPVR